MKTTRNNLKDIMTLAWSFVKRNGFTMAEALKVAWLNAKVTKAMRTGIVKFYFLKVDSTLREAYGTLKENLLPATQGTGRRANDTVQTYFDTEKGEWRCFKKANLVRIANA
ncbi:DUF2693 domain-containing protein [Muribaculaceae bacterium Isolate-039 (Harlan)]|nr:DUF2693 domain-containing protein [Muribaculaceae bacterium Isolate-039 (Harlan)]